MLRPRMRKTDYTLRYAPPRPLFLACLSRIEGNALSGAHWGAVPERMRGWPVSRVPPRGVKGVWPDFARCSGRRGSCSYVPAEHPAPLLPQGPGRCRAQGAGPGRKERAWGGPSAQPWPGGAERGGGEADCGRTLRRAAQVVLGACSVAGRGGALAPRNKRGEGGAASF